MSVRERLRHDLQRAMRERDRSTASTIKSALAAIDNAEAVPVGEAPDAAAGFSPDVPRRELTDEDRATILRAEADELRSAAQEYERLGSAEKAGELREAIAVLARYVDPDIG